MDSTICIICVAIVIILVVMIIVSLKNNKETIPQSETVGLPNPASQETFFALGDRAYIDDQGDIGGTRIMTNGLLDQSYESLSTAIRNNQPLVGGQSLGVARGDAFEEAYGSWKQVQDNHENNPTAVKSQKEMADIAKQISSSQSNNASNIYSRAGSTKEKIVMNPLGTVGVCADYTTPERDRNHKIYTVSHAVHVPGFNIDTNRINQELTDGGQSWAKKFSPSTNTVISTAGTNGDASKSAKLTNDSTVAESFTRNIRY